jgi:hypothetical protein
MSLKAPQNPQKWRVIWIHQGPLLLDGDVACRVDSKKETKPPFKDQIRRPSVRSTTFCNAPNTDKLVKFFSD